jgi:hypothetical protein
MSRKEYYINRALISLTVGALLAYFTRSYWLGLGFAFILFAMYAFYARRKNPAFFTPSSDPAQLKQKQALRTQILIIGLSAALVVFVLLFVVQTRYILPFQPAGFALIAGVLAGVLTYYLKIRKKK